MSKITSIAVIFLLILSIFQDETRRYVGILSCILIVLMNIANNQTKGRENE